MRKLRTAVIGCGAISRTHFDAIRKCDLAEVVYAVDTDINKAKEAASQYGCSFHADYRRIISDPGIDVVHLCTPHYLHAPMAIEAMKNNKHVLTEKPMATSVEDAQQMISVSKETGMKLGVCFQNRYNTLSVKTKELLASGRLGRILGAKAFVTWHRDRGYYVASDWKGSWEKEGGGLLINQAIHTLDLLQWFIGEIHSIKGSYLSSLLADTIEVEDTASAVIRFKNGVDAVFFATNCYAENSPVYIEILLSNGVIRLGSELTVKYNNGGQEIYYETNPVTGEKSYWGDSHRLLIQDFYSSILNSRDFPVDGEQGITALKMVKAIYKSSETGMWFEL